MVPVAQETTANTVRLPYSFSRRFSLVAWCEASLEILHVHPLSLSVLQELQRGLNAPFTLRQIDEAEFEQRLNAVWQRDSSEARQLMEDLGSAEDFFTLAEELPETEDLLESDDDAPIIKLINAMLAEAIKEGASDIHIETFEKSLVIRFRVDGTLHEMLRPGRKLASLLVSRIKVMARLDIAEKRVPQDGRIALLLGGRAIDVRVSTMPSAWGERVVLRLLDKNQARLTLERLGLSQQLTAQLRQLLHKPHGIFLVTGPTGSGKSTTLYAGLQELNNHSRNILTVEDPIEYMIEGIGQTQVNTRVGMTFARGLRAILRQDPDVVMVGEIRDTETAEIAVQASLTGHLVLSTLHTNTAVGAITRLQDMGVEPFLLSSSLTGVMAQRLVRTLCPDCRQPAPATDEEKRLLGITDARTVTLYHPQGCPACNHKGFRGRTAIHELIVVDATLRDLIHRQAGELELERYVRQHSAGIRSNGIEKVLAGETSLDEVLRALGVLIDAPGYQFMQRRQGQWLPVSATRLSAQVTVPKQVQMLLQPGSDIWQKEYALELQRRRLTLHDIELELQKEAKKKTPQIRFSPFEPATPFTLRFYSAAQNACWAVKLAHDGALSLNQCDERMP
ncbi:type II secretion system protein E [Escherichia coli 1-182-04_S1_C3]|nr:type II secretion system ATPase GspE [Escherichia coli]EZJ93915.1 type II secretion system protein E [Escherichia coli 1-182-04_S1_C3]EZK28568.1 type II secretion system protein E [Escherichia coli 1-182-04_S1_C1]KDA67446.1 type II secretion system protein E [Escherichia coli 1-182-04_S1_C2]